MLTILIVVLMGLAIGLWLVFSSYGSHKPSIGEYIFGAVLGAIMGVAVGTVLTMLISSRAPMHYVKVDTKHLVAMKDTNTMYGSFFLGSGSVHNEWVYSFYKKNADNSIEMDTVKISRAKIFEDGDSNPRMDIYKEKLVNGSLWLIDCECHERYEFHIPKGGVLNQFKMDAE